MAQEDSTFPQVFPQADISTLAIALYQPEIPLNVGSIARTCAVTGVPLHLVGTLGFRLDNRLAKRAGLDYWEHATVEVHRTWEEFIEWKGSRRTWLFSTKGKRPYWDVEYTPGDVLVFGSERTGLPGKILGDNMEEVLTIPMLPDFRSLNLSNAVSIAVYEAVRQFAMRE
jgi:tRNA (cytidine/uridine-2'-O-)-methyltransferase